MAKPTMKPTIARDDGEGPVREQVEGQHRSGGPPVDERPDDVRSDAEDPEPDRSGSDPQA